MTEERAKRKLSGILSADAVGYSRLMQEDEASTIQNLEGSKELMSKLIEQFKGRVVDAPGDNLLAEFSSVVDATECAVEIQGALKSKNAEIPDNRRMDFRIGVNLGDVVEEAGRIYGDGINIAARIEGLARPGGICISRIVFDQVKNKLKLGFEYLGEHSVKNIAEPVRVYKVLIEPEYAGKVIEEEKPKTKRWRWAALVSAAMIVFGVIVIWNFYFRAPPIEPASVEKMAYPLPDKPSIAVLPFVNMSGDPEQEYIGDSITENIITALSYIPEMFVIARTSTSSYKGKDVKVKQVSEELGVRYVLEGSIQKAGDRIRVTAQLIDAISGHHLWADRYDREIKDFFDVLDEITKKVVIELQVKLAAGDISRISHRTENFEAWASATRAYCLIKLTTKENIARARELFEKAVELDPQYGFAWGGLGAAHNVEGMVGWSESPEKSFRLAVEYTDKALKLDKTLSCATSVRGRLYRIQGQFEQAIITGEKAIALGPSDDLPYSTLSETMRYAGRFAESITLIKKSMRLNPHYPAYCLNTLAMDYFHVNRYEDSIEAGNRLLERARKGEFPPLFAHLVLSAAYIELGRKQEAESHVEEVLSKNPKFSLEYLANFNRYKNKTDFERYLESLRKAGFPEHPPLPLPDKPSIAVLAFDNLSPDPEQEYFSDGISEEIISALSKTDQLFVIARNSSFVYKGKPVDVKEVAKELGVRYVLEGSVRKSEDRVRVTAQLIDAKKGNHLWSARYDRDLKDIFALQDEITMKIVTALQVKLTEGEQMRMWAKKFKNLDVYFKAMEALSLWRKGTKESFIRFGQLAQEVVDTEPESPIGYRLLGWYNYQKAMRGISPGESINLGFKMSQKALSLDEFDSSSHALLGSIYLLMRKYKESIASGKRAVELNPNGAMNNAILGNAFGYAGRLDEADAHLKKAIRLNPFPPYWYYLNLGRIYWQKGCYDEAITELKKAVQRSPDSYFNYLLLTAVYVSLDRQEEAEAAAQKVLEINPEFSIKRATKGWPYKPADLEVLVSALRKVGLPE